MSPIRLLSAVLLAACLVSPSVSAEDPVYSVAVPLQTPKKSSDKRAPKPYDSAPVSMWLPAGAKVIRGAVVNPFYEQAVGQEHWRAACERWDFALVGANLFGVRGEELGPAIKSGLEMLAEETGRKEIAQLPMCFVGMSAGGGMSTRLTEAMPGRTIAAAPVCLEVGPRDEASRSVPLVTIFGERDGRQMERLLAKLPAERAAGAQWAIAVQWRKRHEFARANNLAMPWFDRVIGYRLGDKRAAGKQPELATIDNSSGYVGLVSSWDQPVAEIMPAKAFSGKAGQTCWFPGAYLAHVWQSFVTPLDTPLRISAPAGMGDGGEFQTYPADKPLAVSVKVAGEAEFDQLIVYDGDQKLAEVDRDSMTAAVEGLEPGIYALIVRGVRNGQTAALSRPHTVIVK